MFDFAHELRGLVTGLRVSNGGMFTAMSSMLSTMMSASARMEHDITRGLIIASVGKERETGKHLGEDYA